MLDLEVLFGYYFAYWYGNMKLQLEDEEMCAKVNANIPDKYTWQFYW